MSRKKRPPQRKPVEEPPQERPRTSRWHIAVVVAGLVLTQAVLYGPSLVGLRILLPLDILTQPRYYMPVDRSGPEPVAENRYLGDQVMAIEFRRRFATREVRAGRFPLWNPYNFCGAPFFAANNTAVLSPYRLLDYLAPSPVTIAWTQVAKALVSGLGAFVFFRRVMGVHVWAATIGAWAYPLTGFFVVWQGFPPSSVITWLPWLLWSVHAAVFRPSCATVAAMSLITAMLLLSGHAATAGQLLIASGTFAAWCLLDRFGLSQWTWRSGLIRVGALVLAWALGFALSAPQNLTTIAYLRTSSRIADRASGDFGEQEYRIGLGVAPEIVLPRIHGTTRLGNYFVPPHGRWVDHPSEDGKTVYIGGNRLEGAAAAYAGMVFALILAPLGWLNRRLRSINVFWMIVGFLAATYVLDINFFVPLWQLPVVQLFRNNRFVFLTAWSILALAVAGADYVLNPKAELRPVFLVGAIPITLLAAYCGYRFFNLPDTITGDLPPWVPEPDTVRTTFTTMYLATFLFCIACLGLLAAVRGLWNKNRVWLLALLAGVGLVEMVHAAYGVNPQTDPELYYPRLEALEFIQQSDPGRVCGINCLPACLNMSHDLYDIRGYDGADPLHLVRLLESSHLSVDDRFDTSYAHTATQWFIPLPLQSPILDMLNLRYRIARGKPNAQVKPTFVGDDYWVLQNDNALPRAFVPSRTQVVNDPEHAIARLIANNFDPRRDAYVEAPELALDGTARGTARITAELPSALTIEVDMQTPGLVVLSDLWYPGWEAKYNGEPVEVYRTNSALRGVVVPAGTGTITYEYRPRELRIGLLLAALALGTLCAWGAWSLWVRRQAAPSASKATP